MVELLNPTVFYVQVCRQVHLYVSEETELPYHYFYCETNRDVPMVRETQDFCCTVTPWRLQWYSERQEEKMAEGLKPHDIGESWVHSTKHLVQYTCCGSKRVVIDERELIFILNLMLGKCYLNQFPAPPTLPQRDLSEFKRTSVGVSWHNYRWAWLVCTVHKDQIRTSGTVG